MDVTPPTTIPVPAHGRRPWFLSWPALIVLFSVPGIAWSLASPLFSVPDEPSHVVQAVAVWHGQLFDEDEVVQVPALWAEAAPFPDCFAFKPASTADCSPAFAGSGSGSGSTTDVITTAGHYPPLFYALVGWGGRLSPGPVGVYLMRLTSAIVCGLLLAASVRALIRVIDPRLAVVGVLVAATPMVYFLAGSVNSNGLEVAAAIAVWCTLLAVLRWGDHHDEPIPRALIVQLAVAGSVMAVTRPLSPAFLGAVGVLALISVPVASVRRVLRDRAVLVAGGVVAVVAALATAFIVTNGTVADPLGFEVGDRNPLFVILGQTSFYVEGMVGTFGWLDTHPPLFTLLVWFGVVFGLLALGLTLGSRRSAVSLLLVLGATLVLPVAAQLPSATQNGVPWQGRYTLPIAVGLPLLAVVVIGGQRSMPRSLVTRAAVGAAALTGVASVAAFYWALRRYITGATGSLRITSGAWQPPGGALVLLVVMAVFAAATVAVVVLAGRAGAERDAEADRSDARAEALRGLGDVAVGAAG